MASFKNFDERGKAGESLNVVFLGGSLTWGANATDPNKTSYRARMGRYLQERYPEAHVNVHDAAIGGTGSQLGMFRLDRDVLAHNPDLVFVELTNARVSWLSVARKDSIFLRFSQDGVGASSKSTTAKLNEQEK